MKLDVSAMCCDRFADFLCRRKERGMAIIPFQQKTLGLFFQLSFRALSASDAYHMLGTEHIAVCSRVLTSIRYCPWCGSNLATFYSSCRNQIPVVNIPDDAEFTPDVAFSLVDDSEPVTLVSPTT